MVCLSPRSLLLHSLTVYGLSHQWSTDVCKYSSRGTAFAELSVHTWNWSIIIKLLLYLIHKLRLSHKYARIERCPVHTGFDIIRGFRQPLGVLEHITPMHKGEITTQPWPILSQCDTGGTGKRCNSGLSWLGLSWLGSWPIDGVGVGGWTGMSAFLT